MAAIIIRRRRQQIRRRRPRTIRDRTNPVDLYDDVDFYCKFRFTRRAILELTDLLQNDIDHNTTLGSPLLPVQQVCLTIRYFATGTFQNCVGEMAGISQPTVSRTIQRVVSALMNQFGRFVRPPTQEEVLTSKRLFQEKAGFPNVFACIDGTHIKIIAPSINDDIYVNRKNFHSVNVQIVCDASLKIIDCVASSPGSFHDARILRGSFFWQRMEAAPRIVDGLVLGDSGYPITEWLMTPYNAPLCQRHHRFNTSHRTTRNTVERCIGVLKRRWSCLHTELRLNPVRCCRVIYACAVLHNFAIERGIPNPPDDELPENPDINPGIQVQADMPRRERARLVAGQAVRDTISRNFF